MKTINDFDFNNKKALIRVDFNVPLDGDQKVTDNSRIHAAKQTIIHVLESGGSCILMSHLGRPKGKENRFSLSHIVKEVSEVIGVPIQFADDCIGYDVEKKASSLRPGEILLLENLRFHEEEKKGDEVFAKQLSKLADVYINDAFGTAHRTHASTAIIAKYFDKKCFGFLLEKEIMAIEKVLQSGKKPVTAILGGAKISSKIVIIENIMDAVDHLIICGGMAFTFIKAKGGSIGSSICERDKLDLINRIEEKAKEKGVEIHLPVDVVVAKEFKNESDSKIVRIDTIPNGWQGVDAGPDTLKALEKIIMNSKTIIWNGPVGVFEFPNFAKGTKTLVKHIATSTRNGAFSLVGGGDSVAAVKQLGLANQVSYISTGGGAMLESLEGKKLPGIVAMHNG